MKNRHIRILVLLALSSTTAIAGQPLAWPMAASVEIPHSTGKFDFLRIDAKRHRLLAAHENDGTEDIFDLQTNAPIARIKLGGAVDTAVNGDSSTYYVSVQEAKRVAVVDATSLKETASIPTPGPTDAILYLQNTRLVYVTHDDGRHVWVIDPAKLKLVATIDIPGVPEYMVYDELNNKIYLNIKDKDLVVVIDPSTNKTVAQWPTAPASLPHGLALDAARSLLYSAGGNGKLVALDTKSGKVVASVDITPKVDQIALDPAGGLIYCAGPDRMSVIHISGVTITSLGELPTAATAKNVAVDPATRAVWTTYTDGKSSFATAWLPPQR